MASSTKVVKPLLVKVYLNKGEETREIFMTKAAAAFDAKFGGPAADTSMFPAIEKALNTIFDGYDTTDDGVGADDLELDVLTELGVSRENRDKVRKSLAVFIANNKADTRAAGKLLQIKKGPHGGARRWSDIPLTDAEKSAAVAPTVESNPELAALFGMLPSTSAPVPVSAEVVSEDSSDEETSDEDSDDEELSEDDEDSSDEEL